MSETPHKRVGDQLRLDVDEPPLTFTMFDSDGRPVCRVPVEPEDGGRWDIAVKWCIIGLDEHERRRAVQ